MVAIQPAAYMQARHVYNAEREGVLIQLARNYVEGVAAVHNKQGYHGELSPSHVMI